MRAKTIILSLFLCSLVMAEEEILPPVPSFRLEKKNLVLAEEDEEEVPTYQPIQSRDSSDLCFTEEGCCFCWEGVIEIDFLWWYARESNLAYAVKNQVVFQAEGSNGIPNINNLSPNKYKYLPAEWRPGVRVGFNFLPDYENSCTDFLLEWTYYTNRSKASTSAPEFTDIIPTLKEKAITNPWLNGSVGRDHLLEKVKGEWEFQMNLLDLDMGVTFALCDCVTMRPFFGLRFAWTRTDFDLTSKRNNASGIFSNRLSTFTGLYEDQFKNRFWGGGLTLGFQPIWQMNPCFDLFTSFDASLLWGNFRGKKREIYFDETRSQNVGNLLEETDYDHRGKYRFASMQTILDLAILLRYQTGFCCDRFHLMLAAGWEHHIWLDHNTRFYKVGLDQYSIESTLTELVTYSNIIDIESKHNVVFGGLVLRGAFSF